MPLQASFKFGNIIIKMNCSNEEDFFRQASIFTELPCACAKCDSRNIGPMHRIAGEKKYEFFNLKCLEPGCGALFDVGQKLDGGLFPKVNPDDRENHTAGWYFYEEQNFESGGRGRDDDRRGGGGQQQRGRDDRQQQQRGGGGRNDDRNQQRGGRQDPPPRGSSSGGNAYQGPEDDEIPF